MRKNIRQNVKTFADKNFKTSSFSYQIVKSKPIWTISGRSVFITTIHFRQLKEVCFFPFPNFLESMRPVWKISRHKTLANNLIKICKIRGIQFVKSRTPKVFFFRNIDFNSFPSHIASVLYSWRNNKVKKQGLGTKFLWT